MAKIELEGIRHSYPAAKGQKPEWALEHVSQVWEGARADVNYSIIKCMQVVVSCCLMFSHCLYMIVATCCSPLFQTKQTMSWEASS